MPPLNDRHGEEVNSELFATQLFEAGCRENQERARTFYLGSIAASQIAQTDTLERIANLLQDFSNNGIKTW